jgi:hypothetical protein
MHYRSRRDNDSQLLDQYARRMVAVERGVWPGVEGCVGARTTYVQFYFFFSAMNLALVTFAVEKPHWALIPFGLRTTVARSCAPSVKKP